MEHGAYIIRFLGGKGPEVIRKLDRLGYSVQIPHVLRKVVHRRYRVAVPRMQEAFPGYAFLRDTGVRWREVLGVEEVIGVLQGAVTKDVFAPILLLPGVIEQIDAMLREFPEDVPEGLGHLFRMGDSVKIMTGPFTGFVGMMANCNHRDRVTVDIEYRGNSVALKIPTHMVKAV